PLNEEGGIQYLIYQKKKTLFLPKIKKIEFPIDKEIVETLNAKSALYIPLVSKDKCVGIICFSNLDKEMKLSKNEIITITNLCAQISGAIQTAHLLERVDKAKKESDLLNEISKTANSNLNIHQIIYNTMDYIKSNFEIDICSVMLPNKKYSKIKTIYLSNKDSIYYEEGKKLLKSNAFSLKEPNNIHGKVFQSKKTHYSKDLEKSENDTERKIIKLFKLRNFICIPLILKEEVIGFLDFSKYNGEMELSEEDVSFLEKVADVLATSINNSKLLMETEKKKKETEELNKLIKSLNEELDVSLIMDKFFRFVNKEFNIQYYGLYSINPDQTHLEILNIKFPDFISEEDKKVILNYKLPLDNLKGAHAFTLRTKKTFHLPKIKKSRVTEEELFLLEKGKFQSILMIPLILNNKPIGILDLSNCFEPMAITKEDFTRLSILGEQLAGIINGSSLFKQVQEEREIVLKAKKEVEATKQEIEFFNEFSKKINSSNILEEIFDDAVMELFDRLGTDFFWLQMVNKKNNQLVTRCLAGGINPELNKLLINWKVNYSSETQYLFKSWSDQKTIYVKDINKQNNENLHEIERTLIRELKTNSVFTIP
ncbi:MAG: GAF domain-containing protein, partial [Leptospiraceae bacterium]|nr:GAF domain-containing protein [Leptospiraceae bacterium]